MKYKSISVSAKNWHISITPIKNKKDHIYLDIFKLSNAHISFKNICNLDEKLLFIDIDNEEFIKQLIRIECTVCNSTVNVAIDNVFSNLKLQAGDSSYARPDNFTELQIISIVLTILDTRPITWWHKLVLKFRKIFNIQ